MEKEIAEWDFDLLNCIDDSGIEEKKYEKVTVPWTLLPSVATGFKVGDTLKIELEDFEVYGEVTEVLSCELCLKKKGPLNPHVRKSLHQLHRDRKLANYWDN